MDTCWQVALPLTELEYGCLLACVYDDDASCDPCHGQCADKKEDASNAEAFAATARSAGSTATAAPRAFEALLDFAQLIFKIFALIAASLWTSPWRVIISVGPAAGSPGASPSAFLVVPWHIKPLLCVFMSNC